MAPALALASIPLLALGGFMLGRFADQVDRDRNRRSYKVRFPAEVDPERVKAWLRAISRALETGPNPFEGVRSVVFETWSNNAGITHRLKVPWTNEYVMSQIALIPGVTLEPEDEWPNHEWTEVREFKLTNSGRLLRIPNPIDLSTSILRATQHLEAGESMVVQWVVCSSPPQHKPVHGVSKTKELNIWTLLNGGLASRDEVEDERKKLDEPNMLAVLRVGVRASTPKAARDRIRNVGKAIRQTEHASTKFHRRVFVPLDAARVGIQKGRTPLHFPMQLSLSELTPLIGWPLGDSYIQGLSRSLSRKLPVDRGVPSSGRVIGTSNFAGQERPVALGYTEALTHMVVSGSTGVGKTALLANMMKQDMEHGHGLVLIEAKGDLYRSALNYVPKARLNDVIVLDVNDTANPVGFNVLHQGDPAVVVDELKMIFDRLFPNTAGGMWLSETMYHALHTLALDTNASFVDLAALVYPDDDELEWRDRLIAQASKDPQLRAFWRKFFKQPKARQEQIVQPVLSRVWPMSRTKLLNIVGQSESSFSMDDVVRNNKIVLINLSGIERESASLMGTILMNSLWNSVKRNPSPEHPTFLYLDEAHHYMNLPFDVEQMLVEARSRGLGVVLGHQYLDQFPPGIREAVKNSARTKVVFQTGHNDARDFARALGSSVTDKDILNLPAYEAIARVATPTGISPALTLSTLPPQRATGTAGEVLSRSRSTYGRKASDVQQGIIERRLGRQPSATDRRPTISDWD